MQDCVEGLAREQASTVPHVRASEYRPACICARGVATCTPARASLRVRAQPRVEELVGGAALLAGLRADRKACRSRWRHRANEARHMRSFARLARRFKM